MSTTTSGWQLRRISGPDFEPLTLDEARLALKLDTDLTDEDQQISDWIVAAREQCEDFCKRTWCESTWLLTLDQFPDSGVWYDMWAERITLPMGPVIQVEQISYVDQQGERLELEDYQSALDAVPGYVMPPRNQCWPFARCGVGQIAIQYRAGYQSGGSPGDASKVPASVRQTMRAILSRWNEKRGEVDVEDLLLAGLHRLRVLT
jgi:uncharacterized phiE125 gp8 family phage protein